MFGVPNVKNLAFDTLNVDALITLWEKNVQTHAKEKDSRLHFYFHNTLSGKNPSAVEVAEASMTKKLPNLFGLLNIFDDPLTEGPEPISMLVDRAQGLYGFAGQQEL